MPPGFAWGSTSVGCRGRLGWGGSEELQQQRQCAEDHCIFVSGWEAGCCGGACAGMSCVHSARPPAACESPPPRRSEVCPRHTAARVSQAAAAAHGAQAGQGYGGGAAVRQRQPVAHALAGAPAARCPRQASQHAALAERQPRQAPVSERTRAARARQAAARRRGRRSRSRSLRARCCTRGHLAWGQRPAEAGGDECVLGGSAASSRRKDPAGGCSGPAVGVGRGPVGRVPGLVKM